jgi:hypothetical protein
MTLLIGTVSKDNIVLTADGLSRPNPQTGAGISSQDFQKIYPLPNLTVAIVHHGFNILNGLPVKKFIQGFIESNEDKLFIHSIREIACCLREFSEPATNSILSHPTNKGVVGFWIAGFGYREENPEIYEICWPYAPTPKKHYPTVLGGDGKQYVECFLRQPLASFTPDKVFEYSVTLACEYHQAIYSQAEEKQNKSEAIVFGGKQHQLIILKDAWKWTIEPKTAN